MNSKKSNLTLVCVKYKATLTTESIQNVQNWIKNSYHPNTKIKDIYRREGKKLMRWKTYRNDANLIQQVLKFNTCPVQCNVLSVLKKKRKQNRICMHLILSSTFYSSLGKRFIYNRICLRFKNFKSFKCGIMERTVKWTKIQDPLWLGDKMVRQNYLNTLLYIISPWFSLLRKRLEDQRGSKSLSDKERIRVDWRREVQYHL